MLRFDIGIETISCGYAYLHCVYNIITNNEDARINIIYSISKMVGCEIFWDIVIELFLLFLKERSFGALIYAL